MGEDSPYETWKGCGVGSFVVVEHHVERKVPNWETIRNRPDFDRAFAAEPMLKGMGIDLQTGKMHHVVTTRTRLLEIAETALTVEFETTPPFPAAGQTFKERQILRPEVEPPKETRTVVSDDPDAYAEVLCSPFKTITPSTPPKESEESLWVAGRSLHCHVRELTFLMNGLELWVKTWTSDEVPGRRARREMRSGSAEDHSTRIIVTSFEKK